MSFTTDVDAITEILGMGQSLFFGICVFMARQRSPANRFLAAFMFALVVFYLDGFLSGVGVPEPYDDVFWPADYPLPPLIYLYAVALMAPNSRLIGWRWMLHMLPFGLAVLLLMPYLALPPSLHAVTLDLGFARWEMGNGEGPQFSGGEAPLQWVAAFYDLLLFAHLSLLQVTVYIFAIVIMYWRYRRRIKDIYSNIDAMKLKWLGFVAGLFLAIWLVVVPVDLIDLYLTDIADEVELAMKVLVLLAIYALGIVGLRQPVVFDVNGIRALEALSNGPMDQPAKAGHGLAEGPEEGPARKKYLRSALSNDDAERIAVKIDRIMTDERLFLDSTLTLPMLAERTGISVNDISQAINQHLRRNFFDFVNGYRIAEAKRRLATTDDSILDIALAVGFNAKSTFNAAFKKAVGDTPSHYRSGKRAVDGGLSPTQVIGS